MINEFAKASRVEKSISGEEHSLTSVPSVIQVNNYPVVENSETLTWKNTTSGETAVLEKNQNYTVISYEEGKFNITDAIAGNDIVIIFDYKYLESTSATNVLNTLSDKLGNWSIVWFPIVLIVIIAVIIIALVSRLETRGR